MLPEKQRTQPQSAEFEQRKRDIDEYIESLRQDLKRNRCFKQLDENKQNTILEKPVNDVFSELGVSRSGMAKGAGFTNPILKPLYEYHCDYVHSGSFSTLQAGQTQTSDELTILSMASIDALWIALVAMIRWLFEIFPGVEKTLDQDVQSLIYYMFKRREEG